MGILESLPVQRVRPVLFLPLFLGTLRDYSGYGNHGSNTGGHWGSARGVDGFVNGEVNLNADASLNPADLTIFGWGNIESAAQTQYFAATTDVLTRFYMTATALILTTGGGFSSINLGLTRFRSAAVTATAALAKPSFYINGGAIGLGHAAVALAIGENPWNVAGFTNNAWTNPFSGLLFYPAILTPSEISDLHIWSQSRITPRKQWPGGGLRYPDRGDPYTPATGDPLFLDNIQTARVTLANQTSGKLSNTPYTIESGTWALNEDAATGERYIQCVASGLISRRNLEAYGTWEVGLYHCDACTTRFGFAMPDRTAASAGGFRLEVGPTENVRIIENGVAVLTQALAAYVLPTTAYRYRVTRSVLGVMTTYIKGGSFTNWTLLDSSGGGSNPATSPGITTSLHSAFDFDVGDRLYLDRQTAGVVSPV